VPVRVHTIEPERKRPHHGERRPARGPRHESDAKTADTRRPPRRRHQPHQ